MPSSRALSAAAGSVAAFRRLGALVALVMEWKKVVSLTRGGEAAAVVSFLTNLQHDFWNHHYTLAAGNASSSVALIGESRAAEILANVIYPLAVNDGREVWNDYKTLRAQLSNQAARIARGANLVPGRSETRSSVGAPTIATSASASSAGSCVYGAPP